jgi:hypothetical protein
MRVFINTLLPIFAVITLVSNALAWFSHRQWHLALLGLAGPAMVLATLYLFWTNNWSTYLVLYRHRADAGCFDMGSRTPCAAFKL